MHGQSWSKVRPSGCIPIGGDLSLQARNHRLFRRVSRTYSALRRGITEQDRESQQLKFCSDLPRLLLTSMRA
jgi:hypothetical protein